MYESVPDPYCYPGTAVLEIVQDSATRRSSTPSKR